MIDIASLYSLTRGIGKFVATAEGLTKAKGTDATKVIEFCEHVRNIIEDISKSISLDRSLFLGGRAEELRQWARMGVPELGKSLSENSKTDLANSLIDLADRLDADRLDEAASQSTAEIPRAKLLNELDRSVGRLNGIIGVLKLRQGKRQGGRVAASAKWTAGILSTIGSTVATTALTVGVAKVPVVGPTLAAWIQGNPSSSDDTLEV